MPITYDKDPHIGLDPVTVDWSKFEKNPNLNPMEIPIGSVAYYLRKCNNKYIVEFGIVYQNYHDCVILQKVALRDRRMVKSEFTKKPVPFKEFPYQTEWRKLPKGWTWNTRLFEIVEDEMPDDERMFKINIDEPETIIEAYNRGYLVNQRDIPFEKIEDVIENHSGYKLVRESRDGRSLVERRPPDTVGIHWIQCFATWADAINARDKAEAELHAQAEMSELEWSIKLIDHDIDRWAKMREVSDENKARARAFMMQLKDLENIETRVVSEGLQYKYWKKTKWMTVPIE